MQYLYNLNVFDKYSARLLTYSVNYQKEHKIKTIDSPIFQAHSSPQKEKEEIDEYETIVIETYSMSTSEWRKTYKFAILIPVREGTFLIGLSNTSLNIYPTSIRV